MWPSFGTGQNQFNRRRPGLAMAMRAKNAAHHALDTIQTRHWHQLAMKNGGPAVWDAMLGLVEQVKPALAAVEKRLPKNFHGRSWQAISKGMKSQADPFRSGLVGPRAAMGRRPLFQPFCRGELMGGLHRHAGFAVDRARERSSEVRRRLPLA
jgi:hypothetical protein